MVIENTVASRVISPIISALNGSAIQQNEFVFWKANWAAGFSLKIFTLWTGPILLEPRVQGFYDGEGIATKKY